MLLQLLWFIHNQKSNQDLISLSDMAFNMAIALFIAMAIAMDKASSHLEIG